MFLFLLEPKSAEQGTKRLFYLADRMYVNLVFACVQVLNVRLRKYDVGKSKFFGFGNSLFYSVYGAYLSA